MKIGVVYADIPIKVQKITIIDDKTTNQIECLK